jgi:arginine decarboxylase
MSGKIAKTLNMTQSAVGEKGKWTTVIALAVFIPPENVPARPRR